jgi:hypothetical protein
LKIPLHERKIFPKKLVDENEFRPKLRDGYQTKFKLAKIIKPKQIDSNGKVTSIEFISIDDKAQTNQVPVSKSAVSFKAIENKKPVISISLEAEPRKAEVLSEENYKKVIDNLTKHYVGQKKALTSEQPLMPLRDDAVPKFPKSKSDLNLLFSSHTFISSKSEDPELRINIQAIANDYKIAAEIENRKKSMRSQAKRLLSHLDPKNEIVESRPNSPMTVILKPRRRELTKVKTQESFKDPRDEQTHKRLTTSTPILNALLKEKTKTQSDIKTDNKMYINLTVTVEPKPKILTARKKYVDVPPVTIDPELAEMALIPRPFY